MSGSNNPDNNTSRQISSKGKGRATTSGLEEGETTEEAEDYSSVYDESTLAIPEGIFVDDEQLQSLYIPTLQQPSSSAGIGGWQDSLLQQQPEAGQDETAEILRIMLSSKEEELIDPATITTAESSYIPNQAGGIPTYSSYQEPSGIPWSQSPSTYQSGAGRIDLSTSNAPWLAISGQENSFPSAYGEVGTSPSYFRSYSTPSVPTFPLVSSVSPPMQGTSLQSLYTGNPLATSSQPVRTPSLPAFSSIQHTSETSLPSNRDSLARRQSAKSSESDSHVPACDTCRRRKVKCDRQQPVCGFCTRLRLPCTTTDTLQKRGPPTRAKRIAMSEAGFIYDRGSRRWRPIRENESFEVDETLEQDTTIRQTEDSNPPSSESSQQSSSKPPSRQS